MHKAQWGCRKPVRQPYPYPDDDVESLCPLVYFRDHPQAEVAAFDLHRHWSQGILPEAGGLMDQAAVYRPFILAVDTGIAVGRDMRLQIEQRKADHERRQPAKGGSGRRR